jgi:ribosomal protein S18 acetylase RimI-like enzyme
MLISCIDPRTDARYAEELELRYRVLRAPIGRSRAEVTAPDDLEALHVIAQESDAASPLVGCVRFDFASGRLRGMAVDPMRQRQGIGQRLVRALEAQVQRRGVREITLHARATAVGFYERLGYRVRGEPFVEVGLEHREMIKELIPSVR